MKEFRGNASLTVDANAGSVFDLITDLDRLPEWNDAIERVVERSSPVVVGSEWTVRMHPPRMPGWGSHSHVTELDRRRGRFGYETRNTDGNPSTVRWTWNVEDAGNGKALITVEWHCILRTLDRRILAGPIRKRQLAHEVRRSLAALAETLTSTNAPA